MGKIMKTINTYINEKLQLTTKRIYACQPKSKSELKQIIIDRIKDEGNECDLNDIDVSKIQDMSNLFNSLGTAHGNPLFKDFNGDISQWDVSNVKNMECMFWGCKKFNCDISKWDVSNVEDMGAMFAHCKNFNVNISMWNVSKVKNMFYAFRGCTTQPTWYDKDTCE